MTSSRTIIYSILLLVYREFVLGDKTDMFGNRRDFGKREGALGCAL